MSPIYRLSSISSPRLRRTRDQTQDIFPAHHTNQTPVLDHRELIDVLRHHQGQDFLDALLRRNQVQMIEGKHDLTHRCFCPLLPRNRANIAQGNQTNQVLSQQWCRDELNQA